jgi:hypothetical protein
LWNKKFVSLETISFTLPFNKENLNINTTLSTVNGKGASAPLPDYI